MVVENQRRCVPYIVDIKEVLMKLCQRITGVRVLWDTVES